MHEHQRKKMCFLQVYQGRIKTFPTCHLSLCCARLSAGGQHQNTTDFAKLCLMFPTLDIGFKIPYITKSDI